jgi:hypothetical protein
MEGVTKAYWMAGLRRYRKLQLLRTPARSAAAAISAASMADRPSGFSHATCFPAAAAATATSR